MKKRTTNNRGDRERKTLKKLYLSKVKGGMTTISTSVSVSPLYLFAKKYFGYQPYTGNRLSSQVNTTDNANIGDTLNNVDEWLAEIVFFGNSDTNAITRPLYLKDTEVRHRNAKTI